MKSHGGNAMGRTTRPISISVDLTQTEKGRETYRDEPNENAIINSERAARSRSTGDPTDILAALRSADELPDVLLVLEERKDRFLLLNHLGLLIGRGHDCLAVFKRIRATHRQGNNRKQNNL